MMKQKPRDCEAFCCTKYAFSNGVVIHKKRRPKRFIWKMQYESINPYGSRQAVARITFTVIRRLTEGDGAYVSIG